MRLCVGGEGFAFYTSISSSYGNFNLFTYKQLACWSQVWPTCPAPCCTHFPVVKLLDFADCDSCVWIEALHRHPSLGVTLHSFVPSATHSFCQGLHNWMPRQDQAHVLLGKCMPAPQTLCEQARAFKATAPAKGSCSQASLAPAWGCCGTANARQQLGTRIQRWVTWKHSSRDETLLLLVSEATAALGYTGLICAEIDYLWKK